MTIRKDVAVKITGDKAVADHELFVYELDYGIELYFKLLNYKYKYDKDPENILNSNKEDILEAYTTIVNPLGKELKQLNGEVIDDTVRFLLEKSYTDELTELGIYELQIHVKCTHSEFSIPPISFRVIERLKGDTIDVPAEADVAKVDISVIESDVESFISSDGKLQIVWNVGDVISSAKLNQMVEYINDNAVPGPQGPPGEDGVGSIIINGAEYKSVDGTVNLPDYPTFTSELENDSGYLTFNDFNPDNYVPFEHFEDAITGILNDIDELNNTVGDINTILDSINGEEI